MRAILSLWVLLFFAFAGGLTLPPEIYEDPSEYGSNKEPSSVEREDESATASRSRASRRGRKTHSGRGFLTASGLYYISGRFGVEWPAPRAASSVLDLRRPVHVLRI